MFKQELQNDHKWVFPGFATKYVSQTCRCCWQSPLDNGDGTDKTASSVEGQVLCSHHLFCFPCSTCWSFSRACCPENWLEIKGKEKKFKAWFQDFEWFNVFLPIKIWESYLNQEFTTEQFSLDASEIVTVVCEVYWASTTLDQRCWCSSSAAGSIAERWCAFQTVECGFSPTALHRSDPWLHLCTFFVSILGTHLYSLKLKQQDLQYSRQSRTWTCNLAKI